MPRIIVSLFALLLFQVSCIPLVAQQKPVNPKATSETKHLYKNLQSLSQKGIMFGHQDALAYGMGWAYQENRSDVKEVAGEFPAVVGWDLGYLELGSPVNLDSVPFDKMRTYVQQVYAMGGLNTFSWHLNNPLDPTKTSWDKMDATIQHLFRNPEAMQRYEGWLDKLATFLLSLKGPKGELIPVVFRPLHEHTGSWFWWGREHCSPEEYKQFWQHTVHYLRKKKVNNVLYAYSTDRFTSREDYLERYPGDNYVDIVGFDIYHRLPEDTTQYAEINQAFVADARCMVETLRAIGQEKKKVWVLSETGLETLPVADWWTNILYPVVKEAGLAYVLVWRNGRPDHYYAPYPGQKSAEDFKKFASKPDVWLMKSAARENIYSPIPKSRKNKR
ncbi:glycoside hydrolase family 26 protein [Pontibacter sp. SGAir0037]|uniref:glycoside hydrolase family 26 protein n=1 Tax=Pontibacter sp. SGAir0037 TaxID=2571030 RepID=UPI0010CD3BC9|nr:glycosyl hydrolase [Pontibacter sp. SGAir0037]QCR22125.1 beta-mannosidase [Pontibacter sp. SGAir0037]